MMKPISMLLIISLWQGQALADSAGGGDGRGSRYAPFQELIDAGNFQQAITKLDQALTENPDDPDLLNLVAYSHRKLERFEIAFNYYQKALQLEPDHLGANEYLGELYLRLGQVDRAEERLAVLDKECFFGCDEFDKLEQAIDNYRKQNPS